MGEFSRKIFLDTETTGLSPVNDRIIEIGCVEMIDRSLTNNNYHKYINSDVPVSKSSLKITGITNEFLKDKPKFYEIHESLLDYLDNSEIIMHNAPFDIGFLRHEFSRLNIEIDKHLKNFKFTDSLPIARNLHPGKRNSLDALAKRYNIEHIDRTNHGALIDSQILAQVYLAMTGGQDSLFSDNDITNSQEHTAFINANIKLKVVKASEEDLLLHKDILSRIVN